MGFMMHYFKIEKKSIVLTTAVLWLLIYGVFSELECTAASRRTVL